MTAEPPAGHASDPPGGGASAPPGGVPSGGPAGGSASATGEPAGGPPGGAVERTILAWVRTGLAFGGCTLLVARVLPRRHPLAAPVAALLGVALAAVLVGRAGGRYRAGAALLAPATLLALTAAATVLALAALLAVLTRGLFGSSSMPCRRRAAVRRARPPATSRQRRRTRSPGRA